MSSLFDIIAQQKANQNEYFEEEKTSTANAWLYSFLTAFGICLIFSSFFLTQIDRLFGESKVSSMLFKEDGEPTYFMNFFQLTLVFIIIKFISKW